MKKYITISVAIIFIGSFIYVLFVFGGFNLRISTISNFSDIPGDISYSNIYAKQNACYDEAGNYNISQIFDANKNSSNFGRLYGHDKLVTFGLGEILTMERMIYFTMVNNNESFNKSSIFRFWTTGNPFVLEAMSGNFFAGINIVANTTFVYSSNISFTDQNYSPSWVQLGFIESSENLFFIDVQVPNPLDFLTEVEIIEWSMIEWMFSAHLYAEWFAKGDFYISLDIVEVEVLS